LIPDPDNKDNSSLISILGFSIVRFIFLSPDRSEEMGISALTLLKDIRFLEVILRPLISFIPTEGGKNEIVTLLKLTLSGNCLFILSTI